MKVKTNFKQMYLVDTILYNKLTFKDDPSFAWIERPMNPNIHIHNKHTPSPASQPSPATTPHTSFPATISTPQTSIASTPHTSFPLTISTPSATSKIIPSVDFLKRIYTPDGSDHTYKDWMKNEQENVQTRMNETKDTVAIPKQKQEPLESMEIEHVNSSSNSKPENNSKGNMSSTQMEKVLNHRPIKLKYNEPLKSLLSHPTTPNIVPHTLKLPQPLKMSHASLHPPAQLDYNQPLQIQYNQPPPLQYNTPPPIEYINPLHLQYNQPPPLQYNAPSSIDYNNPLHLQYNQPPPLQYNASSSIDYNHPPHIQYIQPAPLNHIQPSQLQYNSPAQIEHKQPAQLTHQTSLTPLTSNRVNESSQKCIDCDDKTKVPAIYKDYNSLSKDQDAKTKITFKCTICNTDFNKKLSLMRHNRDFHDAFYQTEKGIKRKTTNIGSSKKRVKTVARAEKRKSAIIKHTDNKKPNTEMVVYEPFDIAKST